MKSGSAASQPKKIGFFPLVMSVITMVVGGGVFSLCSDMVAAGADGAAIIQAWAISGVGVLCLVLTFFALSRVKPELKGGIYSYARDGFGQFVGFASAWGYWISTTFSIISYCPFLFSALGYFFPVFGDGTNLVSVVCASALVWAYIALVLRGVSQAAIINSVVTISKMVPIFVTVVAIVALSLFDPEVFLANLSAGPTGAGEGLLGSQRVMAALTTTIWVFVGIESAVAISGRARREGDVGTATVTAYAGVLGLYVAISLLALGMMPLGELAQLSNPPLAGLMEASVGRWGAVLINVGVVLSMIGSMLGYLVVTAEVPFEAAVAGAGFPRAFGEPNRNGAPRLPLILSGCIVQFFLVSMLFSDNTYQFFYSITTSLILLPYLMSTAYLAKVTFGEPQSLEGRLGGPVWVWRLLAVVGACYSLVLFFAVGPTRLAVTSLLYAPGMVVYVVTRRRENRPLFSSVGEKALLAVLVCALVASVAMFAGGGGSL